VAGFNVVPARREVIFSEMYLSLDDGKLVAKMAELVVLVVVSLDFGGGVPVVEVGNGVSECVVGGSGTVEESVEPGGEWFGDVLG
jgi:hypothetical protein